MAKHYDTAYKEVFSYPEFVQQLIEGFIPSEIADIMDFSTLTIHSGNYITPLFEEKLEYVVWSVDKITAIIQASPHKERIDRVVTRWIKRHLSYLGAEIKLDRLNSLVEDKDMLAENLENLVKKERNSARMEGRLEGHMEGRTEGRTEARREVARNLIKLTEMEDAMIAKIAGLPVKVVTELRSTSKH